MALERGTRLGSYEILSELGSGGMGEVYKARDTKLRREIALKILPREVASDYVRLRRFEQEARAASALNHPNIVTIYEIGEHEGTPYIAMEYVPGQTLREKLAHGPLPTDELVRYASQMAEGLAKAHQAGIVHRDLKPENIIVSEDGYVKILDFGLAKVASVSPVDSEAKTIDRVMTNDGVILGTVSYMSPEQASGRTVDFRSDQFALGTILYEMATGKRPFERETAPQTLAAIIEDEPTPVALVNPKVSASIRQVVDRCLSKDPADRYATTWDLATDIHVTPARPSRRHPIAAAGIVGVLAIVLVPLLGVLVPVIRDWVSRERRNIESIAVLPIENLSGDPEQEYFADGMTEALIADLAKIRALDVISRTSVMQYKQARKPLEEIARELNVDGLVEGSVLREGDRVRITIRLVDPVTSRHLWSERYERDLTSILVLQGDVARDIAGEIAVILSPEEDRRLAGMGTIDPDAHDAYLKGGFHLRRMTPAETRVATGYLEAAAQREPTFAMAYAALSQSYFLNGWAWGDMAPSVAFPLARDAAEEALRLDGALGEAHTSLAYVKYVFDWDWEGAEQEFRRGIDLSPNSAYAHLSYSLLLRGMLRFDEAIEELERARRLDPLSPIVLVDLALNYLAVGQLGAALERSREAIELDPRFPPAYLALGRVYRSQGRHGDAIEALSKVEAGPNLSLLGRVYAESGRQEDARLVLEKIRGLARGNSRLMASVADALGELDQAVNWIEMAYREKDPVLVLLQYQAYSGEFDNLRDDPRFQELLRRMNFPGQ